MVSLRHNAENIDLVALTLIQTHMTVIGSQLIADQKNLAKSFEMRQGPIPLSSIMNGIYIGLPLIFGNVGIHLTSETQREPTAPTHTPKFCRTGSNSWSITERIYIINRTNARLKHHWPFLA